MRHFYQSLFFYFTIYVLIFVGLSNQVKAQNFDFYVLALSWSPSYCEYHPQADKVRQCDRSRDYAFVVHGLWPQRERGWPEYCRKPGRMPRHIVDNMLQIMPSKNLIRHQWDKHGTCSGLEKQAYFDEVKRAYEKVRIPDAFLNLPEYKSLNPQEVEAAFIMANKGLEPDMIAVTCKKDLFREVRICLDKTLQFRACHEVNRKSCRKRQVIMPPIR